MTPYDCSSTNHCFGSGRIQGPLPLPPKFSKIVLEAILPIHLEAADAAVASKTPAINSSELDRYSFSFLVKSGYDVDDKTLRDIGFKDNQIQEKVYVSISNPANRTGETTMHYGLKEHGGTGEITMRHGLKECAIIHGLSLQCLLRSPSPLCSSV